MGLPLNHPFKYRFSLINHPLLGTPMTMETTIWIPNQPCQEHLLVPAVLLEAPDIVNAQDGSSDVGIDKPGIQRPATSGAKQ